MAKLLVLYDTPADRKAFEAYYVRHVPLARKIPGLKKLEVSVGEVRSEGPSPCHMVASLTFDSMADLQAGLASPEGQAAAADMADFTRGSATILMFQEEEI